MRAGGRAAIARLAAIFTTTLSLLTGCGTNSRTASDGGAAGNTPPALETVFLIVMENKNWAQIVASTDAAFINGTLVPMAARATQYFNPPHLHPSEPNYIWMEAGDSLGIVDNNGPDINARPTTDHLVTYLTRAGISWRAYVEDIDGMTCPLTDVAQYASKHDPFVFFDDVTGNGNPADPSCIAHLRPFTELAGDLQAGRVARYNFLAPNLCHAMHNCGVAAGDAWLHDTIPLLTASSAYRTGGVVFLGWEEGEGGTDGPVGMLALSPFAKAGQESAVHHDHSSLLKTLQEIFGVTPLLRHAGDPTTTDLSDLFTRFP